jgi:hypothetical protein
MKTRLYISLVACAIFVYFPETYGQDEVCDNLFVKADTARLETKHKVACREYDRCGQQAKNAIQSNNTIENNKFKV